ncbi:hypothetical protein [Acidisoma sp. 7E03]
MAGSRGHGNLDRSEFPLPPKGGIPRAAKSPPTSVLRSAPVASGAAPPAAGKPGAERLRDWLDAGQLPRSNAPISIEETITGRLFAVARRADPTIKARDAGERAIVDWLAEKVAGADLEAVVVYESGKVPRIIANQAMDANIDVVTTRAFLKIAEHRSLVTDAASYWRRVAEQSPTANPAHVVTMDRRLKP